LNGFRAFFSYFFEWLSLGFERGGKHTSRAAQHPAAAAFTSPVRA
jgi:hypothetical protein